MTMNRRQFIGSVLATSVAAGAPAVHSRSKAKRYRTAVIGCGWWGGNVLHVAMNSGECEIVALCDVDTAQLEKTQKQVQQRTGQTPKGFGDYRELLKQQKPDIVVITTPDHWHALQMIDAVHAGAHVFVEKPIGHTIHEGRAMVEAVKNSDRVVQVDFQRRGSPHHQWAIQQLQDGRAGEIGMVRAFAHSNKGVGEAVPNAEPPETLDWDMWCGPAPKNPFNPTIHPKGHRYWLNYANGRAADWGVHFLDHILWWSGQRWPRYVSSVGGKLIRENPADAPDTQMIHYEFDGFVAEWEHRMYTGSPPDQPGNGLYFYGTKGTMHIGWGGATFFPRNGERVHKDPQTHKPDGQNIPELWADMLDAIKNRRQAMCDIQSGHYSSNLSLLGILSWKLGRGIEWDGQHDQCVNDSQANQLLRREYRAPWKYPA
jgi:predicted dehydrogenase